MNKVFLVAGSPGSGKSWVCEQLSDKFNYVPHDKYLNDFESYLETIHCLSVKPGKPVLTEAPFSISKTQDRLSANRIPVTNVYIVEPSDVLSKRYLKDRGQEIPKGHLTRQETYKQRAKEQRAFCGTSSEVLEYLRNA